jgi:hypothetical protein
VDEAREWRARAEARYDELLARHQEAFADHAAEFWLEAGADPHRALSLAKANLEVRQTSRAHDLMARATLAVADVVATVRAGRVVTRVDGEHECLREKVGPPKALYDHCTKLGSCQ